MPLAVRSTLEASTFITNSVFYSFTKEENHKQVFGYEGKTAISFTFPMHATPRWPKYCVRVRATYYEFYRAKRV